MAELQTGEKKSRRGIRRGKKLSTRVDLTPMVDLGFLLITFFIFTTALSKPNALGLVLPDDTPVKNQLTAADSKTLNLVLEPDNKVICYNGLDIQSFSVVDYSSGGLRLMIQNKMKQVAQRTGNPFETTVLIKPTEGCTYQNVVAALDEMQINAVKRFVLMDPSTEESGLTHK